MPNRETWIRAFSTHGGDYFLVVALAGLLAYLRFSPWMASALYGDDLYAYLAFQDGRFASSWHQALLEGSSHKYRPIFQGVEGIAFHFFGSDIRRHLILNFATHLSSVLIFYRVALRAGRGNRLVGAAFAIVLASSRFALFELTSIAGILEALAFLFFLVTIDACMVLRNADVASPMSRIVLYCVWATLAGAGAIFTHERYLVIAPWLMLGFLGAPCIRALPIRVRFSLALLPWLPGLFNIAYKTWGLHDSVLTGTGGTNLALDPVQALSNARQAIYSIMGFNSGPEHLVGHVVVAGDPSFLLAVASCLCMISLALMAVLSGKSEHPRLHVIRNFALSDRALLASLFVLVLVPPILTIRMEQRWLLAPFALLLLGLADFAGSLRGIPKAIGTCGVIAVAILQFEADGILGRDFDRIYLVQAARFAAATHAGVVEPGYFPPGPLTFFAQQDKCSWALLGGAFFQVYEDKARLIQCLDWKGRTETAELRAAPTYQWNEKSGKLLHVDVARLGTALPAFRRRPYLDLLDEYSTGQVHPEDAVDTPSGHGALLMPTLVEQFPVDALVVTSGHTFELQNLEIRPSSSLLFGATMVFNTKSAARARVRIRCAMEEEKLRFERVLPLRSDPSGNVVEGRVALSSCANRHATISFEVDSPGGNSAGHWIAFLLPRLVKDE
jgi:hypothetical protein